MAKAPPKGKATEQDEDGDNDAAVTGKAAGKKKLILLVIIGVVLLAICAGGTFAVMHFMGGDKTATAAEVAAEGEHAEGEEGEAAKPEHAALVYFPFEPPFLTNFVINGRPRYLQLSITVASRDQETIDALQKHMPLVRNRVVMLLSSEQFDILRSRAGREALQGKLIEAVKEILQKETGKADVEKLLFTNFVMQ
ncbi:MAG: flagellar basal body-associated FliL family protein [Spongiibacteraceae bacterium]